MNIQNMKDRLIRKLGGSTKEDIDSMERRNRIKLDDVHRGVEADKTAYKKAATELINSGEMVRVTPDYGSDDFVVQFKTSKRFVEQIFTAGNDEDAIRYFSEQVGESVYHAIRCMNFTRPVQYRKPYRGEI